MLHKQTGIWLAGLLACASLVGTAFADDKKSADKPKRTQIVIQIDASKLPPGLLKQLLQYAEPTTQKQTEGQPKAPAKPEKPEKVALAKPRIVQVDLNQLSPELRKRLEAELGKSKVKKDDAEKRPSKPKKDDDDDDDDDRAPARRKQKASDGDHAKGRGKVRSKADKRD